MLLTHHVPLLMQQIIVQATALSGRTRDSRSQSNRDRSRSRSPDISRLPRTRGTELLAVAVAGDGRPANVSCYAHPPLSI